MDEVTKFFSSTDLTSLQRARQLASIQQSPQLVLIKQNSHSEEKQSKNGLQKLVYVVVKSSPFTIVLGSTQVPGYKPLDFNHLAFDASLVYDGDQEKEVDFVKVRPIDIKTQVGDNGESITIEVRIKVLTSHHEDMLFRIKFRAVDPLTHQDFNPPLYLYSGPIKVISKPEQLKKRVPSRKRTLNDILVDTVTRIEKQQEEHQKLIMKLVEHRSAPDSTGTPATQLMFSSTPQEKETPEITFQNSFSQLLKAYNALPLEDRAEKIRKLIRQCSAKETEQLSEILDLFWCEGLRNDEHKMQVHAHTHNTQAPAPFHRPACSCQDCPHKAELERIDEFYKEFLSAPLLPQNPGML